MRKMKINTWIMLICISLMSFTFLSENIVMFEYPEEEKTTISLKLPQFNKLLEEWQGKDYYYMGIDEDSIVCSVLYYKLTAEEKKKMVNSPRDMVNSSIPLKYFSENSKLKKYEANNVAWGEKNDDFMFRQNDVLEFEGIKFSQKNMYAYCMFGDDLFVNVHLSKLNYSTNDSIAMRGILNSLKKISSER